MKRKRKKKTTDRVLPPEFWERHERTQRMLAERIAYHTAVREANIMADGSIDIADEVLCGQLG